MNCKHIALGVVLLVAVLLAMPFIGSPPTTFGQEDSGPEFVFTHYDANPILTPGSEGEWDSGYVFASRVVFHNGMFHMFYTGGEQPIELRPWHIGYASSPDGFNWTKSETNPVLQLDPMLAGSGASTVVPLVTDEGWVLYISARQRLGFFPGNLILRATAPEPTGPWTVDEKPVIPLGVRREWDRDAMAVDSIVVTDAGYVLYYTATGAIFFGIGQAASTDGIAWQKYDDPATDEAKFAVSDPVFWISGFADAWNGMLVSFPSVLQTEDGWEMFYFGAPLDQLGGETGRGTAWSVLHSGDFPVDPFTPNYGVGYAVSEDGVIWTEVGDGPVLTTPSTFAPDEAGWMPWAPNVIVVDDTYYVYYSMWDFENELNLRIGVATGTVSR
jgi:hypothetical protein